MSQVGQVPQAHRFVFDRVFAEKPFNSEPDLQEFDTDLADQPADATFSEADLETARRLAFEEGHAAGRADGLRAGAEAMRREAEAHAASALASLNDEIRRIGAAHAEMFDSLAHDCERLVGAILDRLLPELVRRDGTKEVLGVVRTALSIACNDPVIEVRVPHDLVEILRPRIAQLADETVFRGRIDLLGDSYLTGGMVRARWSHGGAQRDPGRLLEEVTAIIERTLRGATAEPEAAALPLAPASEEKEGE